MLKLQSFTFLWEISLVLKWDSLVVKEIEKLDNPNLGIEGESDPYELFMYALNTDLTKEEYITRDIGIDPEKKLTPAGNPVCRSTNCKSLPQRLFMIIRHVPSNY
jgi:hypothetical protein